MTIQEPAVKVALNSWRTVVGRADKVFSNLTEEQLLKEVAPGKNRLIYLLGHLTAIQDRTIPILGFGEQLHPELDAIFISSPDRAAANLPAGAELKRYWGENEKLLMGFERLSPSEWFQRHNAVSDEEFAKDPTRNRFAILLSRTNHLSYHLGQAALG